MTMPPRAWVLPRLAVVTGLVFVAGLVALASFPTGADTPEAVAPADARVAARQRVEDVHVLVLSRGAGNLRAAVAYRDRKGWFGVVLDQPPTAAAAAAWAATRGGGNIPPLSALYGRADAARVQVSWADGRTTSATVDGGVFVAARRGYVRSRSVRMVDAAGAVVQEVPGP